MASPPPDSGPRRSSRPKRTITVAESDEENDIPKPAPKKTKAQKAKEAKDVVVVSDDEEEAFSPDVLDALKGDSDEEGIEDDDSPPPKSKKGKKSALKATAKKERAPPKPRKKKEVTPATESEDDEADGPTLKLGDKLPSIKLKNEDGELVDVSTLAGEKGVVFFLYPKADTPGCTNQACGFRDMYAEIAAYDYEVYGLSKDLPTAQQKWKAKKNLNYHLLSDPKSKLIERLGAFVPPKNTKRSHFIFEKGTGELIDAEIGVRPVEDPNNVVAFLTEKYD
ncbi:hypothetical protein L202_00126 [Cryptococcus amylolentus CBS 6039]|uniref:thioredoxin-dependent peroxiredoxin n=1 Tax=Cryptococcus amylolentus CBS 6039 TaxID=1295533 RepID=A0A1E3I603_9TREE|nr:hypothetical protein L202_00126 [Cryptococcus amylolentus CBS 6039]ODN84114.1 hypothetical protein L202_00126 [Cryptococcus amylolentus CBS 6039]